VIEEVKPASVTIAITGEASEVWLFQAVRIATFDDVDQAFRLRDLINAEAETWEEIHDLKRGIFLLDIEHDPLAAQALEVYAFAASKAGDRPLCDELIQKINKVRARRKA
jgi:hypothetical protein